MRRVLSAAALLIVLVGGSSRAALAQEKSYSFPRVAIVANVLPDGSLSLTERRTFDFHGSFAYAYFTVENARSRVKDFRVGMATSSGIKPLHVIVDDFGYLFRGTWYFDVTDREVTFVIRYKVRCAVDVFSDAAHLLWQFIGTGWTEVTDLATIKVHLPPKEQIPKAARPTTPCGKVPRRKLSPGDIGGAPFQRGDVRAWGHGPLNGDVSLPKPDTVVYRVTDLPAGQFVEGSILFPPDVVPFAYQHPRPARARILAQEADLAGQANALRGRHHAERLAVLILLIALPAAAVLLPLIAKWRDRRGIARVPHLLQEPPEDIHPVQLALMWSAYRGHLSPKNAYRVQLLHLARLGVVDLQAKGLVSKPEDIIVRKLKEPQDETDLDFVRFLFSKSKKGAAAAPDGDQPEGSSSIELREVHGSFSSFSRWYKDAQHKSKDALKRLRKGESRAEALVLTLLAVAAVVYALIAGADVAGSIAYWLIPVAFVSWFVGQRLLPPRLPAELRERMIRWAAFRRFLKKFSSLPDAPALAVVIWEQYLELATALNVAKEVEKQVKTLIPADSLKPPWPGAPAGIYGYSLWTYFNHAAPASSLASSAAAGGHAGGSGWGSFSSSGGFGGGFSGGGGFGGGGTGGGAG